MSDALVDPEMIPKIDTSYVTNAAKDLRDMGSSVGDNTDGMKTAWTGLQTAGVYEAPESATVYSLLDPAATAADTVESALSSAADAMDTFASDLDGIKSDLDAVRADVTEFRARALKGVDVPAASTPTYVGGYGAGSFTSTQSAVTEHKDWWDSPALCDENTKLFARINDQVAKIVNAENQCVNTLHGLIPDQCFEQQPTNVTGEALDQLDSLPWGKKTEYEAKNCGESAVLGVGDGIRGLLEGGGSLISYNPRTGEWGDWSHAGQAWSSLGDLGLSIVVAGSPLSDVAAVMRLAGVENSFTDFVEKKELTVANTVASLVNIDLTADDPFEAWKKDGVRSLFSSATNIGTFFIPGADAGSVLKLGAEASTAAKAGGMALRGAGTIADMIVPGGSFVVRSAGEFGVRVADVATHGGEGVSMASRAATAVENGALHDLGRVDGVTVRDGSGLDLSRADVGGVDVPSLADAGAGTAGRGSTGSGTRLRVRAWGARRGPVCPILVRGLLRAAPSRPPTLLRLPAGGRPAMAWGRAARLPVGARGSILVGLTRSLRMPTPGVLTWGVLRVPRRSLGAVGAATRPMVAPPRRGRLPLGRMPPAAVVTLPVPRAGRTAMVRLRPAVVNRMPRPTPVRSAPVRTRVGMAAIMARAMPAPMLPLMTGRRARTPVPLMRRTVRVMTPMARAHPRTPRPGMTRPGTTRRVPRLLTSRPSNWPTRPGGTGPVGTTGPTGPTAPTRRSPTGPSRSRTMVARPCPRTATATSPSPTVRRRSRPRRRACRCTTPTVTSRSTSAVSSPAPPRARRCTGARTAAGRSRAAVPTRCTSAVTPTAS